MFAHQQPSFGFHPDRHAPLDKAGFLKAVLRRDPGIRTLTGQTDRLALELADLDLGEHRKLLEFGQLARQHRRLGQQQQALIEAEQAKIAPQLALGVAMAAEGALARLQGIDVAGDLALQIFHAIIAGEAGDGQIGQGKQGWLGRKNRGRQAHDGIPETESM